MTRLNGSVEEEVSGWLKTQHGNAVAENGTVNFGLHVEAKVGRTQIPKECPWTIF